jgi:sugar phosphate isomerase/epimerase
MHNRRNFLKQTGAFALGSLALSGKAAASFFAEKKQHAVGVQLFTFFTSIDKDVPGTLKAIAGVGYKEIESAFSMKGGYYGLKPKEFAQLAKDSGLTWASHHVSGAPFKMPPGGFKMPGADTTKKFVMPKMPPMMNLKDNHQQIVDDVAEGGLKFLVCASIPLGTGDEVKEAVDILSKAGEAAKKAGITLCYHNHTHEFEMVDGVKPYDVLLSQVSADLLKFELDLGWATVAGVNPPELFKAHPGRFPLWHVKDISADKKLPTEVGTGMVNFKPIFAAAKTAGVKHFFVEQDGAPKPIENITTSFNYISSNLL